ncbi:epoxide hydrolase [Paenibacillus camelliae]|nr:epoxide hydrolase [Paenibacillus camelliae]
MSILKDLKENNSHAEEIRPFRIHVTDEEIADLRERLGRTRLSELPDTGWERGVPLSYVTELKNDWQNHFDWRKYESRLNQWPQFITEVDGQPIHFLHIRSSEADAKPLMLIHGWPGSFVEFLDAIGPLTNPRAHGGEPKQAYHLVIPSIPGFGYSIPLRATGWTPARIASAFIQLMDRLGYTHYGVQGGDTGAFIAPEMARQAPDRLLGIHLNALLTFPSGEEGELNGLTEEEQQRLARMESFNDGYLQIQSKSPNTLAYALHDSPVGQLAWIAEIFKKWSYPVDALAEQSIDRDLLLTNISLYWFSCTSGSSAQVYYESMNDPMAWIPKDPVSVPTGVLVSRSHDTSIRSFAARDFNIVHWVEYSEGGHFFALEQPQLFVEDVRQFFTRVCK